MTVRSERSHLHESWRQACAGCGQELRIHEVAGLVNNRGGYLAVCFGCRDASKGVTRGTGT